jgi:uncharacterized membrane protein YkvA (DUF1232 family)
MPQAVFERLKTWARRLKRDVVVIWIAARDPRTPMLARLIAAIVAAYAFSPIDLIPDFVPVLGYLDDLILVPLGIALVIRMIPPILLDAFTAQAKDQAPGKSTWGIAIIAAIWISASIAVWRYW